MAKKLIVLRLLLHLVFTFLAAKGEEVTCDATDNTCTSSSGSARKTVPPICPALCTSSSSTTSGTMPSLYRHGGTAQAYKSSDVPFKTTICDPRIYSSEDSAYRVASWPFSRSKQGFSAAPTVRLSVNLWSCSRDLKDSPGSYDSTECCCQPLSSSLKKTERSAMVEIWQARPDGTYPSLRRGIESGDCRARASVTDDDSLIFETVGPGSVGSLGGLGPSIDLPPFGPAVIHVLVTADGHFPTLLDIPMQMAKRKKSNTIEERSFYWSDLRGPAWVKHKPAPAEQPYSVASWKQNADRIEIGLDIYLEENNETPDDVAIFCPSWRYSFFLEPISLCFPSLLDFFQL